MTQSLTSFRFCSNITFSMSLSLFSLSPLSYPAFSTPCFFLPIVLSPSGMILLICCYLHPLLECKLHDLKHFSFFKLLYFYCLEQYLVHSRCSINLCGREEGRKMLVSEFQVMPNRRESRQAIEHPGQVWGKLFGAYPLG